MLRTRCIVLCRTHSETNIFAAQSRSIQFFSLEAKGWKKIVEGRMQKLPVKGVFAYIFNTRKRVLWIIQDIFVAVQDRLH